MSSTFAALILGFLIACFIGIPMTSGDYENYQDRITQLEKTTRF